PPATVCVSEMSGACLALLLELIPALGDEPVGLALDLLRHRGVVIDPAQDLVQRIDGLRLPHHDAHLEPPGLVVEPLGHFLHPLGRDRLGGGHVGPVWAHPAVTSCIPLGGIGWGAGMSTGCGTTLGFAGRSVDRMPTVGVGGGIGLAASGGGVITLLSIAAWIFACSSGVDIAPPPSWPSFTSTTVAAFR